MPITTFDALDQAMAGIYDAWDAGDLDKAESLFRAAWDDVPAPKGEHEVAQFVANDFIDFLTKTGQHDKAVAALPWLREAYKVNGDGENAHVDFVAGTVAYDAGDRDAARHLLAPLVAKFGKRPFTDADPKYYEFAAKGG